MNQEPAFVIFIAAIFTGNILLSKFLGMCSFIACSGQIKTALGLGTAVAGRGVHVGGMFTGDGVLGVTRTGTAAMAARVGNADSGAWQAASKSKSKM